MSTGTTPGVLIPPVLEVRRDTISREVRLELADWRTRTGGVYDLSPEQMDALALPGYLPPHHLFLPDFVIVLATGHVDENPGSDGRPVWTDLRVHVGGISRAYAEADPLVRHQSDLALATDWHSLAALLRGRCGQDPAPDWLLDLIRAQTPFGHLLDAASPAAVERP